MSDFTEALPAFITIIMMVLTYSIADGICLGILTYVIVKMCCGRFKDLSVMMYILAAFFIVMYAFK
jgi:AGZA family xanthine/uracil permease-like MFS transporter